MNAEVLELVTRFLDRADARDAIVEVIRPSISTGRDDTGAPTYTVSDTSYMVIRIGPAQPETELSLRKVLEG